jgi:hypothetical protein
MYEGYLSKEFSNQHENRMVKFTVKQSVFLRLWNYRVGFYKYWWRVG